MLVKEQHEGIEDLKQNTDSMQKKSPFQESKIFD